MDLLWHGRKSFNKKRCLETKSKINRYFSRCDAVTSWLARLSTVLHKKLHKKQSIHSVHFLLILLLFCIPPLASAEQPHESVIGANNNPAIEISKKDNLISLSADQVDLRDVLSALSRISNIPITSVDLDYKIEVSVTFKEKSFAEALELIQQKLPAGGLAVVNADGLPGTNEEITNVYVLAKKGDAGVLIGKEQGRNEKQSERFAIVRIPISGSDSAGIEYVANELMVKFDPEANKDEVIGLVESFKGEVINAESDLLKKIGYYQIRFPSGTDVVELQKEWKQDPLISNIEPNYIARVQAVTPNDPLFSHQWGLPAIKAPEAWDVQVGDSSVTVAVLDTGVDGTHPDLSQVVATGWNFVANTGDTTDKQGHGTAMAGIIAATINNGEGVAGVAGGVGVLPVQVLDENGVGTYAEIVRGIIYSADSGVKIINMSFGGYGYSNAFEAAVDYAHSNRAVLVAAGGNEDTNEPIYPAAYPNVIAVSGLQDVDNVWQSSNQGDYIRLAAPGYGVIAPSISNGYRSVTGTSSAAAHVSGVATLALSGKTEFSNTQVEQILYQTANDIGVKGFDQYSGYGRVDAANALSVAKIKVHDIAISNIKVEPSSLRIGEAANILVTIQNEGTYVEKNIPTQLIIGVQPALVQSVEFNLRPGESYTYAYTWTPQQSTVERVVIKATTTAIAGEVDVDDNVKALNLFVSQMNGWVYIKHKSEPHMPTHQYIAGFAWQYLKDLSIQGLLGISQNMVTELSTYIGKLTSTYTHPHNGENVETFTGLHNGINPASTWQPGDNGSPDVPWSEYDESVYLGSGYSGACPNPFVFPTGNISSSVDIGTAGSCDNPGNDIIEGIHEEDRFQLANNPDNLSDTFYNGSDDPNAVKIFYSHFWVRPGNKVDEKIESGLDGNPTTSVEMGKRYFDIATQHYRSGNKDLAYYYLGRVAHHLTDQTVPAHAHGDPHAVSDNYEDYMGNYNNYSRFSDAGAQFQRISGTYAVEQYDAYTTVTETNGFHTADTKYTGIPSDWEDKSKLYRLFWFTAEISDNFDSDDSLGMGEIKKGSQKQNILDEGVDGCGLPFTDSNNECEVIAKDLFPLGMRVTAELYKLFWNSTHGVITGTITESAATPITNAVVKLYGPNTGNLFASTFTQNGAYIFQDLPTGNYYVEVTKSGFNPVTTSPFWVDAVEPNGSIDKSLSMQATVPAPAPTPSIDNVSPNPLLGLPLPGRRTITITGTDFSNLTRLTFNDGTTDYSDRVPSFVSSDGSELHYDIAVGTDAANWTVVAYNGTAVSNPYPFSVTAGAVPPTVLLWANPILVSPGQSTNLTWATGNATSCQASGGWSGTQALNDSVGVQQTALGTTVYVLTCTGPGGTATDNVTVTVTDTSGYGLTMTTDLSPVVSGVNNPLVYTLTVHNQGASTLTGVVLRNDVPVGMDVSLTESGGGACSGPWLCTDSEYLTWDLGNLAVGESRVVQFVARQTSSLSAGFVIHNEMSVLDAGGGSALLAKDVAVVAGNGFVLSLVESQDPVVPGDQLSYTVRYGNRSGSAVANAALIVPIPDGASYVSASPGAVHASNAVLWSLGSLAAGASGEQQLTVSVLGSAGDVIKADALLADMSGAVPSQLTQVTTEVKSVAPVLLTMTTDLDPVVSGVNNPLVYTLTVRNQGASALTGVVLRDTVPPGMYVDTTEFAGGTCSGSGDCSYSEYLTWDLGNLAVGESRVVQFVARQTSSLSAGFVIHNEMSVLDAGGGSALLAKDVAVVAGNGFVLSLVESQDPVVPGDQLSYTVRYGNRSGSAVANAALIVPIPDGASYVSASSGGVYTGSAVQWSLGSLAAGASGEQQLTVSVLGSAGDVLLAEALLEDVSGAVPSQLTQVTTEVKSVAPALLTMTTDLSPVVSGVNNPLVYTLTVHNQGASTLTGVVLRNDVPVGMDVSLTESGGGACSGPWLCTDSEYLTWDLGNLAVGESRVVQFVARQTSSLSAGFVIHNEMSVLDAGGGSALLAKDVAVVAGNGFVLSLVESQDPVVPGDQLSYTVRYGNRSGSAVANAALIVPIPDGASYVSASPGAVHASNAVLWSLGSLAAGASGEQQLTVSVLGSAGDVLLAEALLEDVSGAVPSQLTQVTTEVKSVAPVLLTMTTDLDPVVSGVNNPLVYTLTVRNQGASALTGVVLRDTVPPGMYVDTTEFAGGTCSGSGDCSYSEYLTWDLGNLAVGESRVVQFVARQTSSLSAGFVIHNEMSVLDAGGGSALLAKDVAVVAGNGFVLSLVESQDPVVPGDQLSYTVRYGNRSGSAVANAALIVPIPDGASYVSASSGGVYTGSAVQWSLGSLAAGASGEQQLTVSVLGSAGDVLLAEALLEDVSGAVPSQLTQVTTEVKSVAPALLTMTTDLSPVVSGVNNPLVYTLTVHNQGASTLTGVVLRNDVPVGMDVSLTESGGGACSGPWLCTDSEYLTWDLGNLAVGESRVVQFVARQTSSLSAGFVIHNEMSVLDAGGGSALLAKDVAVVAGNGFVLSLVESQDPVVPGDQLSYTVRYGNRSGSAVANAALIVPIPDGASYVSASPGAVHASNAVLWSLGSLAAGASGEQQLTVSVLGSAGDVLLAEALLEDVSGAVPSQLTQVTTEVKSVAPVLLTMTTDLDPVVSGVNNPLVYTLTVRNQGASALTGVVLRDTVPPGMYVDTTEFAGGTCSGSGDCSYSEYLTWDLGNLAVGESRVVQFVARQTSSLSAGFVIHNEMSVLDAGGGSALLAKDVAVVAGNGFVLSLVESQDPVVPGDQLSYTVRYGNRSGSAVANAALIVPIPDGASYVSASSGGVYTGSAVQWSLGSLAAGASGEQQLTVSVLGSAGDVLLAEALLEDVSGAVPSQLTQVTTEVKSVAPALLTMTTDLSPVVSGVNNPLVYTLTVHNQGASTLTGVVLRNDVPVGMDVSLTESGGGACSGPWLCTDSEYLTWDLGNLAVGESRVVQFVARQTSSLSAGFVIHNEMSVLDAGGGSALLAKDVAVVAGNDDADGDGLTNSVEVSIGTNMLLWDTDGDGLSDYTEVAYDGDPSSYTAGQDLNPFIIDTDGDGFSDYDELNAYNSDPLDINSVPVLADGDLNADGVVNVVDVLLAQQIVSGQLAPTQDQLDHGDVAPLVNGTPAPDGLFNLGDMLVIQRKALGLVNF